MDERDNQNQFLQLLEDALGLQISNNGEVDTIKEVEALVADATTLVQKCAKAEEFVLDASVMSVTTNVVSQCVKKIDANLYAFNENLMVESILEHISGGRNKTDCFSSKLFPYAEACCNKTASLDYMLGSFKLGEREPKKRKERAARQAEYKGPVIKPKNVQLGEKQEDGIEDSLQVIMKVLSGMYRKNHNKPICYFKLVVNPDSFGATVENTYHLSFLVKDGLVELSMDEEGCPVVSPRSKKQTSSNNPKKPRLDDTDNEGNQCIISWNFQDWEDIIETFEITEASIPHRDYAATASQR